MLYVWEVKMEGYLKVTPEKLIACSGEFGAKAGQMNSITQEMMTLIQSLKSVWMGEASEIYGSKFAGLQSDMDKMYRMIMEHSQDLSEMAEGYQNAENANSDTGNGMINSVIS